MIAKKVREENQGGDEAGPWVVLLGLKLEGLFTEEPFGGVVMKEGSFPHPNKYIKFKVY